MDRTTAQQIGKVLDKHLPQINADLEAIGVVGRRGNATYSNVECSSKILFADLVNGELQTKEGEDFKLVCQLHGIDPLMLNKPFVTNGSTYVLTGYKPRARRYPYIFTKDGASMKAGADYIKSLIEKREDA